MGGGLGKELTLVNVGKDTTLCDSDMAKEFVQLFIVADGKLQMTGNDTGLLVVARCVTSQLEDFSSQVFKNGGEIDGSTWRNCQLIDTIRITFFRLTSTNTLRIVAFPQQTVNTSDWKCETGLGGTTATQLALTTRMPKQSNRQFCTTRGAS